MSSPTFTYQGTSHAYPSNWGVFLCSDTGSAASPGTQAHGVLLQYDFSLQYGLYDDINIVAFLNRPKACTEIGVALFNATTLRFTLPVGVVKYDGTFTTNADTEAQLRGIASDQHAGAGCRWQDSTGNTWMGRLFIAPDSFDHQPGGTLGVSATWIEVF